MPTKVCARCKQELPATTEHFPPRIRAQHQPSYGVDCYCWDCKRERDKESYARNREKRRAAVKSFRAANADHIREQKRQSRERNKAHVLQHQAEYRAKNRKVLLEKAGQWAAENPEKAAKSKRAHYDRNRETLLQRAHQWHQCNPERVKERTARRRARLRNAPGHFTANDLKVQQEKQGGLCFYCHTPLNGSGTVDHYIPLSRGGSNDPDNIVLACWPCNNAKRAKLPEEFARTRASS